MTAPPSPPSSLKPPFAGKLAGAKRRRWPYVAGLLFVALVVVGFWPRAIPVEMASVRSGPLQVTIDEEGQTRVKHRYVVASPIAGQLRRIELKPGARVEAGETVLAVLETSGADLLDARSLAQAEARVRAAEAAREQAAAMVQRAAATATLAQAEFSRAQQLFSRGGVSQQELDQAAMRETAGTQERRAAEFSLQVAEFELEQAHALLMRGQPSAQNDERTYTLTAPVTGDVLRVFQESSRVVSPGFPLLEVGDTTDLEARIEVLSRDGVAIQPGARVLLEKWGGSQPLEARVRLVEPAAFTKISALGVEEQRVNVIVDLIDPPEKRPTLGDAYRVEARIVVWEQPDVLQVPAAALFQREGQWQTYVVQGGRARLRSIVPAESNGIHTRIVSGIDRSDTVIVYPGDRVRDGVRVRALSVSR